MVKVERESNSEKIIKAKEILDKEKNKNNGNYNQPEVVDALKVVFNNKCYLCENKKITSYNIEHLKPHRNEDKNLKFLWENLFLACAHCNNIKSDKPENIVDCTEIDVAKLISFRKIGSFAWEEKIEIIGLNEDKAVKETVELLEKIYEGNTFLKTMESLNIRKELREEIHDFINAINEYQETDGEDKEDAKFLVRKHLKSNSPFAAFKRWIVRDNSEKLYEFQKNLHF